MRYRIFLILLLTTSQYTYADSTETPDGLVNEVIDKVERDLETWRHEFLYQTIAHSDNAIKPFTTDGCSGGMSDGWQYMARVMPAFKEHFGNKPPWESCCVTHDKAYWAGATTNGFEKRREADDLLRQCVKQYGQAHSNEYSQRFRLDEDTIEKQFAITAELMYRAIRVGGQPCTLFQWRWGYGWPQCNAEEPAKTNLP